MEHLHYRQENIDLEASEFKAADCSEELKDFSKMVEEEYEERITCEPVLDPKTTILFTSGHHRRRCNFLTAISYIYPFKLPLGPRARHYYFYYRLYHALRTVSNGDPS